MPSAGTDVVLPSSRVPRSFVDPNSRAAIAHLYRRAGFGLRADELDQAALLGYRANVEQLLQFAGGDRSADAVPEPDLADGRAARSNLVVWWLQRMAAADKPLLEKLTFFWHGHFTSSIAKVASPDMMLAQNKLLRTNGIASFPTLALSVAQDPAMMIWLDTRLNVKGRPNENFARELMELFTLGAGNYSETDVSEGARCFTGWKINGSGYRVDPSQHDNGTKNFL